MVKWLDPADGTSYDGNYPDLDEPADPGMIVFLI